METIDILSSRNLQNQFLFALIISELNFFTLYLFFLRGNRFDESPLMFGILASYLIFIPIMATFVRNKVFNDQVDSTGINIIKLIVFNIILSSGTIVLVILSVINVLIHIIILNIFYIYISLVGLLVLIFIVKILKIDRLPLSEQNFSSSTNLINWTLVSLIITEIYYFTGLSYIETRKYNVIQNPLIWGSILISTLDLIIFPGIIIILIPNLPTKLKLKNYSFTVLLSLIFGSIAIYYFNRTSFLYRRLFSNEITFVTRIYLLYLGIPIVLMFIILYRQLNYYNDLKKLRQNEDAEQIALQYVRLRVPNLRATLDQLTPDSIVYKLVIVLEEDVERLVQLFHLNSISVSNKNAVLTYCIEVSEPLINGLKDSLRKYLTADLLEGTKLDEEDLDTSTILEKMFDDLIANFEDLERGGTVQKLE